MGTDGRSTSPVGLDRDALRSALEEYPLRLAVLFGSYVDGSPTSRSDVDVGVVFREDCTDTERRNLYLELHSRLPAVVGTDDIDVTLLDDLPPSVGPQALQTYEVLVGEQALAEELRAAYEATAPSPSRKELVARLDDRLADLDATLDTDSG
jgi:predicted nucleotidyltransferase